MRDYELVMVLSPENDEEQVAAAIERISQFVSQRGGTVTDQSTWGVRRLAYPIKGFMDGNYVLTSFSLEPDAVAELDDSLKMAGEVIRHLVVKVD